MRNLCLVATVLSLAGCGVENAGTVAAVGQIQADQARQGKAKMDAMKADLDVAAQRASERNRQAEEAGQN